MSKSKTTIKLKLPKDYSHYKLCLDQRKGIWQVLLYKAEPDEAGQCQAVVREYQGEPSIETIKHDVLELYDQMTDQRIISGHTYHGALVWLSAENQLNYKAAYDLAVQFQGEHGTLPVTFKLGTTDQPVYRKFETLEDLTRFYLASVGHVTSELSRGWALKDGIDWSVYE